MASTPFIAFLDADDWLDPDYALKTLLAWEPGHYVFTDWQRDGQTETLPDHFPLHDSPQLHLNSCVIHRDTFLALGGYTPGIEMEDSEFWFRAMSRGVCGIRCPLPLVHYSADGLRSAAVNDQPARLKAIYEEYYTMGCGCNGSAPDPNVAIGAKQAGDVLTYAHWMGNHVKFGRITGRKYPRTGWDAQFWADPKDVAAMDEFVAVETVPVENVDKDQLRADIARLLENA